MLEDDEENENGSIGVLALSKQEGAPSLATLKRWCKKKHKEERSDINTIQSTVNGFPDLINALHRDNKRLDKTEKEQDKILLEKKEKLAKKQKECAEKITKDTPDH